MVPRITGDLSRRALEGRAYLKKYLRDLREFERPRVLRTRRPSHPPGLSAEWMREYGDSARIALDGIASSKALTDAEALTMVAQNRNLLPFLRSRLDARFAEAVDALEPVDLERLGDFFVGLGDAVYPSGRGQRSDFDPVALRQLKRERIEANRCLQAKYRRSGVLPETRVLPVVEPSPGHFVTIDDRSWPTEAAWVFLEKVLGAKRSALEDRMKPSRAKRRRGANSGA